MSARSDQHGAAETPAIGAGGPSFSGEARARQVELILQQVESLPTLSPVATKLLSITSVDDADLDELVGMLEADPSMTARILSLVRRADKGANHDNITTVRRAVIMLGLEAVQAAVLSVCVFEAFESVGESREGAGAGFDRVGFWTHAVGVACASRLVALANPSCGVRADEAFVAGLLHDLGKIVLEAVLPKSYGRVLELSEHRGVDSAGVERQLLGLDHHTAGRRLAARWGLGRALQETMWLHSQAPGSLPEVPSRGLIGVVSTAKALCRGLHLGWSGDFSPESDAGSVGAGWGLEVSSLEREPGGLMEEVASRCAGLGLSSSTSPELLLRAVASANRRLSRMNSALQQRAEQSSQLRTVLEAVGAFHASGVARRSVVEVFGEIVRSAAGVFGSGFYGVVFQAEAGEAWHVHQFSADGHLIRSQMMEPPPGGAGGGTQDLRSIGSERGLRVGVMGLIPWLSDFLMDAADLRRVRLCPLRAGRRGEEDAAASVLGESGAAAVLLHDREPESLGLSKRLLEPLVSTWAWAFGASALHEQASRLGERLAESNRSLAEAQARLTEAESLARLGEMAAGAAHEMNNPLTVISGRCQVLADRASTAAERTAAKSVVAAARQLTDLITSLHLLADPPEPKAIPTAVADLLSAAVREARTRTGSMGEIRVTVPEGLRPAPIDRGLIERAVHEVVLNAIESDPSGLVEVSARADGVEGGLVISVRDYGAGLSERGLKHAFDPFFSEKAAGRQCGLGLSRARRLVELHGGRVQLENAPGGGALVRMWLPGVVRESVEIGGGVSASSGEGVSASGSSLLSSWVERAA